MNFSCPLYCHSLRQVGWIPILTERNDPFITSHHKFQLEQLALVLMIDNEQESLRGQSNFARSVKRDFRSFRYIRLDSKRFFPYLDRSIHIA